MTKCKGQEKTAEALNDVRENPDFSWSSRMSSSSSHVSWKLRRGRVLGPSPFFVAGIVNVTPDSFYDGGVSAKTDQAVVTCMRLLDQGADILDIGGESTRPFAEPVPAAAETERVLPVIQKLLQDRPDAVISVDTTKAAVAQVALEAGAHIINDVLALKDPALLEVISQYQPGYVLMHSQGEPRTMQLEPRYDDVVDDIRAFFSTALSHLVRQGVPEENIVLDPGIGFGKRLEHNLEILRRIEEFAEFGRPLFMGLSNKSLWRDLLGREGRERNAATIAATALLYQKGVRIHRVHEVREIRDALSVAQALEPLELERC